MDSRRKNYVYLEIINRDSSIIVQIFKYNYYSRDILTIILINFLLICYDA